MGLYPRFNITLSTHQDSMFLDNWAMVLVFEDLTRNYGEIENSALTIFSIGAGANYKLKEKLYVQLHLPYFNAQNITINESVAAGVAVFLGFNFKLN